MKMRFKNAGYRQMQRIGDLNILVDVSDGVNDKTSVLPADDIGQLRETGGINLFDFHIVTSKR